MASSEKMIFDKEKVRELLSTALTRTYGAKIDVKSFEWIPLTKTPTKSAVIKIYKMDCEAPSGVDVPPTIVYKKYRPEIERTSDGEGERVSCKSEFEIEKAMLAIGEQHLRCSLDDRIIKVYPQCYSLEVKECDDDLSLFREYIREPSLGDIAEAKARAAGKERANGKIEEKLKWEDIKGALYPIALLHTKSPVIKDNLRINPIALPNTESPEVRDDSRLTLSKLTADYFGEAFKRGVVRIAKSKKRDVKEESGKEIAETFKILASKYLFSNSSTESIINGDLDIYKNHLTKTRLLDAGSTCSGPFFCDLAVFLDPCFRDIGDSRERIEKTLEDYCLIRNQIEENLQYPVSDFSHINLEAGLALATLRGMVRKASSIINYMPAYMKSGFSAFVSRSKDKKNLEKEISKYIEGAADALSLFGKVCLKEDKEIAHYLLEKLGETNTLDLPYSFGGGSSNPRLIVTV